MKSKYLIVAGVIAGVIFGTAIAAYASTHTLQFVETPIVQLYEAESYNATSITVTPVPIDLDGNVLTMSSFGSSPTLTVDPGISGYEEIEGFTSITNNGNGTATIGGLTRDLASQYPYTTSGTGRAHAAGSTVVFSNNPQMYARFAAPENTQTWTATQTFSSTTPPAYDFNPNFNLVSSTTFASVGYVASTSYNGTVNGTTAAKGIFQQATALQAASSTAVGSTGANLVLGANIATDTPSTSGCATSGGCVVMSLLNGKLSQLWYDLTQAFTVTGLWTFNTGGFIDNASSTFTVAPILSTLKSTLLKTNSSGQFVAANAGTDYFTPGYIVTNTTATSTGTGSASNGSFSSSATSSLLTIPAGTLTGSSTIQIMAYGTSNISVSSGGSGTCVLSLQTLGGTSLGTISSAGLGNGAFTGTIILTFATSSTATETSVSTYNTTPTSGVSLGGSNTVADVNFANAQTLMLSLTMSGSAPGGDTVTFSGCTLTADTMKAQ